MMIEFLGSVALLFVGVAAFMALTNYALRAGIHFPLTQPTGRSSSDTAEVRERAAAWESAFNRRGAKLALAVFAAGLPFALALQFLR